MADGILCVALLLPSGFTRPLPAKISPCFVDQEYTENWKQSGNYVSNVVAYAYDVSFCWLKMHRYVYVLYCFILLST